MNLKKDWKNTLKNKRNKRTREPRFHYDLRVLIPVSAVVIVLVLIIGVAASQKKKTQVDAALSASSSLEMTEISQDISSNVDEEESGKKEEAKKDYEELVGEIVKATEECTKATAEYNLFLSELEEFAIEGLPDYLEQESFYVISFESYIEKGANQKELIDEAERLRKRTGEIQSLCSSVSVLAYNVVINDYNLVLKSYSEQLEKVSVDFLNGLPTNLREKNVLTKWIRDKWDRADAISRIRYTVNSTSELMEMYLMAKQIENPTQEWITERLLHIDDVLQIQCVTKANDPNGLLSKDGGYDACLYFTIASVPPGSVPGDGPIAKGTDGGGAIEVFRTLEDAKCRCDYLGQYDGTLLYSGSYALLGTMVIRTSYILSTHDQVELTNKIMEVLTELK